MIEFGQQNPDVVMLLHGGGLSWWNYREAAKRLAERYHGPHVEFCVSEFRQTQEYHVINVHDGGLFPLSTAFPVG